MNCKAVSDLQQQHDSGCGHCLCADVATPSAPTPLADFATPRSQEERDDDAEARVQVARGDREDEQRQVGVDQDGKAGSDDIVSGDAVHLDQNVEAILQERRQAGVRYE